MRLGKRKAGLKNFKNPPHLQTCTIPLISATNKIITRSANSGMDKSSSMPRMKVVYGKPVSQCKMQTVDFQTADHG